MSVFSGWDGYQQSLLAAISPLTREQLAWRPGENLRSAGELARHLALGRIDWFLRMDAPGAQELAAQIQDWEEDKHGNRYLIEEKVLDPEEASELVYWLEATWQVIAATLTAWTVDDLQTTYRHVWRGDAYAVSHQWTIWRIMAHDIHHGGELALMLGQQGIENFELGELGGHILEPQRAE
jgi:uncharacterized damage-inducible protein DinB